VMAVTSPQPFAFLTSIYKDPTKPDNLRMDAAKVAIRYERPALVPIEQAPETDFVPLVERLKEYARRDLIEANAPKVIELKKSSHTNELD
jgi:hypothetical protein